MHNYKDEARQARLKVLEMVYKAGSSHIGSNFSVIDILTVLFAERKVDDQIILSAGWKAAAFYYFLAKRGDFPEEWLDTYNQEGSRLIGLTEPGVPGVLFAGGSMQMGVPAAVGFALAKKLKGEPGTVYCVMSDGELAGGMVWESALIAAQHKLDNLVVICDANGLQAMGKTDDILFAQFPKLGWDSYQCDGHSFERLTDLFDSILHRGPVYIHMHTIKGKGVSWMEGNNLWHYKDLGEHDYDMARIELEGRIEHE